MTAVHRSLQARLAIALLIVAAALGGTVLPAGGGQTTVNSVVGSALGYWPDLSPFAGGPRTGPVPTVTLATDASNSPQSASAPCGYVLYGPAVLFTSDTIDVSTAGSLGTSGWVASSSSIDNINKATTTECPDGANTINLAGQTGSEIFTADNVSGTATATVTGTTGSSTVTNGTLAVHSNSANNCTHPLLPCGGHTHDLLNPDGLVPVPVNPPPNYKVAGHVHLSDTWTDYFVVVFNEQITNADGSITVNPVHEYYGAKLDQNGNIVPDPPFPNGSILKGHLYIGQVVAGVSQPPAREPTQ